MNLKYIRVLVILYPSDLLIDLLFQHFQAAIHFILVFLPVGVEHSTALFPFGVHVSVRVKADEDPVPEVRTIE